MKVNTKLYVVYPYLQPGATMESYCTASFLSNVYLSLVEALEKIPEIAQVIIATGTGKEPWRGEAVIENGRNVLGETRYASPTSVAVERFLKELVAQGKVDTVVLPKDSEHSLIERGAQLAIERGAERTIVLTENVRFPQFRVLRCILEEMVQSGEVMHVCSSLAEQSRIRT